jgi:hypothetical protein
MRVPEHLTPARDSSTALKIILKTTASRSVHRNHGTSGCGQCGLDRIPEQCTASQFPANFV